MITTTMLMLSGSSWASYHRFTSAENCVPCFGLVSDIWLATGQILLCQDTILWASSSIQDAAASLPDALNAHSEVFGRGGQVLPAATIDFRISIDGSSAKHASFAVLAVNVASSWLLCTAFCLGLNIGLSFLWKKASPFVEWHTFVWILSSCLVDVPENSPDDSQTQKMQNWLIIWLIRLIETFHAAWHRPI